LGNAYVGVVRGGVGCALSASQLFEYTHTNPAQVPLGG
jgi:hypothetical protein